jgi:hypothetical protein
MEHVLGETHCPNLSMKVASGFVIRGLNDIQSASGNRVGVLLNIWNKNLMLKKVKINKITV